MASRITSGEASHDDVRMNKSASLTAETVSALDIPAFTVRLLTNGAVAAQR